MSNTSLSDIGVGEEWVVLLLVVVVGLLNGVLTCHWPGQTFCSIKDVCLSLVGFKYDGGLLIGLKTVGGMVLLAEGGNPSPSC